jgi:RNA recognition motif-containing protein
MSEVFRLFVGGIPENITTAELKSRFQRFGEVVEIQLAPPLSDPNTQPDPTGMFALLYLFPSKSNDSTMVYFAVTNRGFGHLTMKCVDKAAAKQAIKTYHNCKWRGKVMRVEIANGGLLPQSSAPTNAQGDSETAQPTQTSEVIKPVESKPEVTQLKLRTQSGKMKVDVAAAKTMKFDDDEPSQSAIPVVNELKETVETTLTQPAQVKLSTETAKITSSKDVASLFADISDSSSTFASTLFANAAKQKQESQQEDKEIAAEENRNKKEQRRLERAAKFGSTPTSIDKPVEPVSLPTPSVSEKPHTVESIVVPEAVVSDKIEHSVESEKVKPAKIVKRQGPFDMRADLQLKEDLKAETQMALSWLSSLVGDENDDSTPADENVPVVAMDFDETIEVAPVKATKTKSDKKRSIREVSSDAFESHPALPISSASSKAETFKPVATSAEAVSQPPQPKKSKFKAPPPTTKSVDVSESIVHSSTDADSGTNDVAVPKLHITASTETATTSQVAEPLKKKSKFKAPPSSSVEKTTDSQRFCAMTSSWSSVFNAPDATSAVSSTASAEPFKFGSLFAPPTSQNAFKLSSLLPSVAETPSNSDDTPSLFQSNSKQTLVSNSTAVETTAKPSTKLVSVTDVALPADSLFSLNASLQPVWYDFNILLFHLNTNKILSVELFYCVCSTLPLVNRFTRDPNSSVEALQSKFRFVKSVYPFTSYRFQCIQKWFHSTCDCVKTGTVA